MPTADVIRRRLDLAPHPEGGWYRETFRDERRLPDGRAASTAIYFLLEAGQVSRWHRIDAAEIWHFYAGASLELAIAPSADALPARQTLGPRIDLGEAPLEFMLMMPAWHTNDHAAQMDYIQTCYGNRTWN